MFSPPNEWPTSTEGLATPACRSKVWSSATIWRLVRGRCCGGSLEPSPARSYTQTWESGCRSKSSGSHVSPASWKPASKTTLGLPVPRQTIQSLEPPTSSLAQRPGGSRIGQSFSPVGVRVVAGTARGVAVDALAPDADPAAVGLQPTRSTTARIVRTYVYRPEAESTARSSETSRPAELASHVSMGLGAGPHTSRRWLHL